MTKRAKMPIQEFIHNHSDRSRRLKIPGRSLLLLCLLSFSLIQCQPNEQIEYTQASRAIHASGDVRGVSLFYLDGNIYHGIPWLLDNLEDPTTQSKLLTLFSIYQAAGVNWIRILVAAEHYRYLDTSCNCYRDYADIPATGVTTHYSDIFPSPDLALISKVNRFMSLAHDFTIELMLLPQQDQWGLYTSGPHFDFTTDVLWYDRWLTYLNSTNLGMFMFGGDLVPCNSTGCQGATNHMDPRSENHGAFIRAMWEYKDALRPTLNASYEIRGLLDDNDPQYLRAASDWINTYTPSNPVVTAALYIEGNAWDTNWITWANTTQSVLNSFRDYSNLKGYHRPLWIDEYGSFTQSGFDPNSANTWLTYHSPATQKAAYDGFLGASVCWNSEHYPKFAWVASPDPGEGTQSTDYLQHYGLFSDYGGATPTPQPAWYTVSQYYNLATCP